MGGQHYKGSALAKHLSLLVKSWHPFSMSSVPICSFSPFQHPGKQMLASTPFYRSGNWGTTKQAPVCVNLPRTDGGSCCFPAYVCSTHSVAAEHLLHVTSLEPAQGTALCSYNEKHPVFFPVRCSPFLVCNEGLYHNYLLSHTTNTR